MAAEHPADDAFALTAAVDLGRVEQGDAGVDGGVPCLLDRTHGEIGVVAAHTPGGTVTPGPGADTQQGNRDVAAGQRVAVGTHGEAPYFPAPPLISGVTPS